MKIEIVGMCCAKCKQLAANAEAAVKELNADAEVVKVDDMGRIIEMGILTLPGLAIDGKVISSGRVLSKEEIKKLIA